MSECKHGTELEENDCMNCENEVNEIICMIADEFPDFFNLEGEDYGALHKLEKISKKISSEIGKEI